MDTKPLPRQRSGFGNDFSAPTEVVMVALVVLLLSPLLAPVMAVLGALLTLLGADAIGGWSR